MPGRKFHSRSPARPKAVAKANARVAAKSKAKANSHPAKRPTISMCMIVRDNAKIIRRCLESIRPWVDEMIVVDTGSNDETPAICREMGAKVFHEPWPDSFGAARNMPLRHATGDWIFWMDSDELIDAENGGP